MKIYSCCILLCVVAAAVSQEVSFIRKDSIEGTNVEEKFEVGPVQDERSKRGVFDVLIYGTSILTKVTSLGLTLSNALTGGCATYHSICDDKKAIEQLDGQIKVMKNEYEKLYLENKKSYIEFREANTRNAYISYYINETMRAVEDLSEKQERISDKLEVQMPELFNMWVASKNATSSQYINSLLGTLELSVKDIQDMAKHQRNEAIKGLVIQWLVEAAVSTFIKSYTKSYNQISTMHSEDIMHTAIWSAMFSADPTEAGIILDQNHPRHQEVMRKHGVPAEVPVSFKTKFVRSGQAFKQMFKNSKEYFSDLRRGLQKWTRIRSWKGFKGKLQHSLQGPIAKVNNVKSFILDSNSRKYQISKFRLSWSERIMTVLGIGGDIITIAVDQVQWAKVRDEMRKVRREYESYKSNLDTELKQVRKERDYMHTHWHEITDTFNHLVVPFREFVQNATSHSELYEALENKKLTIDTHDALFSTNLNHITRQNVGHLQNVIINYLRSNNNDLTKIRDQVDARLTLFDKVLNFKHGGKRVDEILNILQNIYSALSSSTKRDFGKSLTKKDVVCVISGLDQMNKTYDYYPLDKFRPDCSVSTSQFAAYERSGLTHRKLSVMHSTVDSQLKAHPNTALTNLLDLVKNTYRNMHDSDLRHFGETIKAKDILCYIAQTHKGQSKFDFSILLHSEVQPAT
ncbi:hypothetical protein FSP39_006113 [Pinctada imbricata]|uniref:Domain of unknown function WSN domain-containing protein n=1 Tax=Pinctada imbricata TaxID=66713 RepID=A0AA88YL42_PINIB|nr:hypothetical protein FSP39_006113 [Pinctada imbricata]